MASNKGKYVSVGQLHYRSELDDAKTPARTYAPGQTIDEDLDPRDVERLLKKGAIREAKQARREQEAREAAALAAQRAEDAAAEAAAVATQAATVVAAEDDGLGDGSAASANKPATVKPNAGKSAGKSK